MFHLQPHSHWPTIPTTFPVIPTYNNWVYPHNLLFVDYPEDRGSMHLQNYSTYTRTHMVSHFRWLEPLSYPLQEPQSCRDLLIQKWMFGLYVRHFFTNLATSNFSMCKQLTSIMLGMLLLLCGKCQCLLYLEHSPDKAVQHIPFCFSTQEKSCNHAWWRSIPFFYIFMVTAMGTKENWNYNTFAIWIWSRITRMWINCKSNTTKSEAGS